MAVLAADQNISTVGPVTITPHSANAADTYFRGAIVFIDVDGGVQVTNATDAADRCLGISPKQQSPTAAGDIVQVITCGNVWLPVGTNIAAADEGDFAVGDDSGTITDNPGDIVAAGDITPEAGLDTCLGKILRVTSTQMLIAISPALTGNLYAANGWDG
jgi:hypothetical protein